MKTRNNPRLTALLAVSALLTLASLSSGCPALAAGAGPGTTVTDLRGAMDVTWNAGFEKSVRAVNKTVDQLRYAKVSENKDTFPATIVARTATDKKCELSVEKLSVDATKLKIRVGTFGDDALQTAILEKVRANL